MSMLCKSIRKNQLYWMFGLSVIFLSFLMWLSPMASDDFEYSAHHFTNLGDLMKYVLYYGNGRVMGNLGAYILVHSPVLAIFVKAFTVAGIIFLVPHVLGLKNPSYYLLSFLLLIIIPPNLFGAVYTWTCGFQNYLPPIWATLVILALINRYDTTASKLLKGLCCAAIFVLGAVGQLYVEHSTLINLFLAGYFVFERCRKKANLLPAVLWLCAALIGAACMFLVPVVFFVEENHSTSYRSVNIGGISALIGSFIRSFGGMGKSMPYQGTFLVTVFTVFCTYVTRKSRSKKWNAILSCVSIFSCIYVLLNEMLMQNAWYGSFASVKHCVTGFFSFLPLFLWVIALHPFQDKVLRNKIYFLLSTAVLSLLPLLFVSPTPERVVYIAYVCIVACFLLFAQYLKPKAGKEICFWTKRIAQCTAVLVAFVLCLTFVNIKMMSNLRETHIAEEMEAGATEIDIFGIPYDYVFWDGPWCFGRKYYYEESKNIKFNEMPYSEWSSKYKKG